MEFKKGPFYLVKDIGASINPILVQGVYEVYPPGQLFTNPGVIILRFLPEMHVGEEEDHNQLLSRVLNPYVSLHRSAYLVHEFLLLHALCNRLP